MIAHKDPVLYHANLFLPANVTESLFGRYLRLTYTKNANVLAHERQLPRLDHVILSADNLIEVGCLHTGVINSAVIKSEWTRNRVLYYALGLDWMTTGLARVCTVWAQNAGHEYSLPVPAYRQDPEQPAVRTIIHHDLPNRIQIPSLV